MLSLMPGLWLSLVCALPTEARYLCGRLEMVISGGLCSQVSATLEIRLTLLAMRAVCVCMTMALSLAWLFLSFVSHPHQSLFVSLLCMYLSWPQTPASASPRLLLQACSTMLCTTGRTVPPLGGSTHVTQPSGLSSGAAPPLALSSLLFPPLVPFFAAPFTLCPVVLRA